jgi:hypothetical protein
MYIAPLAGYQIGIRRGASSSKMGRKAKYNLETILGMKGPIRKILNP